MNYQKMQQLARPLLTKFGNVKNCTLYHSENKTVVTYKGIGVKLNYESEAIGSNSNIIQAGDAKVICQFGVRPVENTDQIEIEGERYNIVASGDTSPDNVTKILYTLQVRRANG